MQLNRAAEGANSALSTKNTFGDKIKKHFEDNTTIGRMATKDENLFAAWYNAQENCINDYYEPFFNEVRDFLGENTTIGRMITEGEDFATAFKECAKMPFGVKAGEEVAKLLED